MKKQAVLSLVITAMFIALILIFGMTPLGLIPLGFINVTILCIPVIIGTIMQGLKTGLILGACFGLTSALSAFGMTLTPPSALASALVAASPLLAIVMCFFPRLMIPVAANAVYKLISGKDQQSAKALPFCAALGSLTNTVLYLGLMLFFYTLVGLDSTTLLTIIGGTGIIAGGSEAVVAALLVTPIVITLWRLRRKPA